MIEATKRCPFCGEEILAVAKKCKHCASALDADAAATGTATSESRPAADYGAALLAIPVISTMLIWFWVSGMNLFQSPGDTLALIMVATVVGTAAIAAAEASKVGMVSDRTKGTYSSTAWFFIITFMWIIGYPVYLWKRKYYGLTSRAGFGVLVGLLFVGSWATMNAAVEAKKTEIRENLGDMQRGLRELGQP